MTYHINVKSANVKEFLQIIYSLRSLGVIESFSSSKDLIQEEGTVDELTLLNILENSQKEIREGKSFSLEDVKQQIETWKKR